MGDINKHKSKYSTRLSPSRDGSSLLDEMTVKTEPTDAYIVCGIEENRYQVTAKEELIYKEEELTPDFTGEVDEKDPLTDVCKNQVEDPLKVSLVEISHPESTNRKERHRYTHRHTKQLSRHIQPNMRGTLQPKPAFAEEHLNTQEPLIDKVQENSISQISNYQVIKKETSRGLVEEMLPAVFSHKVITCDYMSDNNIPGFNLEIDSTVSTKEDIRLWLQEFSERTHTNWKHRACVMGSFSSFTYKVMYICQGASRNKKERGRGDRSCKAFIHIKLYEKDVMREVSGISSGFLSRISLSFVHNHPVIFEEALQFKNVRKEIVETFHKYFSEGHTPASAHHFHEARLWLRDSAAELLADDSINPKTRTIKYMNEYWAKSNSSAVTKNKGNLKGEELFNAAFEKAEKLSQERKIQYLLVKNPFSIVLVTPMMQRVHGLPEASLTVFVNTVTNCGEEKCSITYFLCASEAGVLPLGVVIVSNPTSNAFTFAFRNLVMAAGYSAFGQRGSPMVIISDGFEPQRDALKSCFPFSQVLLCTTHLVHSVWRWLTEDSNNIKDHDRVTLMSLVKNVLYAPTAEVSKLAYRMMLAHDTSKQYGVFNTYMATLWHRRGEVGLIYKLPLNNKDFNELSRRMFIDSVLTRCQSFSTLPMMDFVCIAVEECFQSRISEFIESTVSHFTFLKCMEENILPEIKTVKFSQKVRNSQDDEIWLTVDCEASMCTCLSGVMGGFCEHQRAVWKLQKLQLPAPPVVDAAGKVHLADIAFGEAGYQSYNKLEYDVAVEALKDNLARLETIASQNITNSFIGKIKKLNQALEKITSLNEVGTFCELAANIQVKLPAHENILKPKTNILTPQANVVPPQTNILQSQTGMAQPQTNVVQPQTNIVKAQATIVQPQTSIIPPQTSLLQPQASIIQPQTSILQPQTSIVQPQANIVQSHASVVQPQANSGGNPIQFLVVQSVNK
ncbi:uncharacterized protein [Panulirus ornatus]|uniref:uncharacterized protein isoform X2 n=1 Tax=Panulirus ornatus TaxID=150431 RepID=UPI003A87536C